jgi:chromosome segregation ATPase
LTEFESEKLESIKLTKELRLELAQSVTDLEEERLKTSEENAVMEEALQKMEDSRQDKEIERSKLQENLEEMGANFDAKTKEIRSLSERNNKLEEQMTVLSAQLNGADTESKHQVG